MSNCNLKLFGMLSSCISLFFSLVLPVIAPVSMSVMIGEEATFFCAGKAFLISWTIDDVDTDFLHDVEPIIKETGGIISSNLTLVGSVENNNASIQCWVIYLYSPPTLLPPVFLTVLGKSLIDTYMYVHVA